MGIPLRPVSGILSLCPDSLHLYGQSAACEQASTQSHVYISPGQTLRDSLIHVAVFKVKEQKMQHRGGRSQFYWKGGKG